MKRITRNPKKFGTLDLFTSIGRSEGFRIDNFSDHTVFLNDIESSLKSAITNPTLLHGKRVESMFAQVAGALGQCIAIKTEDTGDLFTDNLIIQAPDYRLVLKDKTQLLVEVKNFNFNDLRKPFSLKADYIEKLERYAELFNVPLKFAIFLPPFNQWVLLSKNAFRKTNKKFEITLGHAFANNEMATIGDVFIGTLPDLRIEMRTNEDEAEEIQEDGTATIVFRSVKIFCAGTEITDNREKEIAFRLFQHGNWPDTSEHMIVNNKLIGIAFTARPEDIFPDQPFSIIGTLSSLVSSAFSEYTVDAKKPIALDTAVDPYNFVLSIPENYSSNTLPLWRLAVKPNPSFQP